MLSYTLSRTDTRNLTELIGANAIVVTEHLAGEEQRLVVIMLANHWPSFIHPQPRVSAEEIERHFLTTEAQNNVSIVATDLSLLPRQALADDAQSPKVFLTLELA